MLRGAFLSHLPSLLNTANEVDSLANSSSRGIGLETAILFAKEGASVLLADISEPALEKAVAKVKELVPDAPRLETRVCHHHPVQHG